MRRKTGLCGGNWPEVGKDVVEEKLVNSENVNFLGRYKLKYHFPDSNKIVNGFWNLACRLIKQ